MVLIYAYGFYVNFYLIDRLTKAGDLGKLGYFYIDKTQTNLGTPLSENKVDTYYDNIQRNYKVMTIGDSFSQQGQWLSKLFSSQIRRKNPQLS